METAIKTPLEHQRENFQSRINALKDKVKAHQEKIAQLKSQLEERDSLMQKDYYKNRDKKLESQKLILLQALSELRRKGTSEMRGFIDQTIERINTK